MEQTVAENPAENPVTMVDQGTSTMAENPAENPAENQQWTMVDQGTVGAMRAGSAAGPASNEAREAAVAAAAPEAAAAAAAAAAPETFYIGGGSSEEDVATEAARGAPAVSAAPPPPAPSEMPPPPPQCNSCKRRLAPGEATRCELDKCGFAFCKKCEPEHACHFGLKTASEAAEAAAAAQATAAAAAAQATAAAASEAAAAAAADTEMWGGLDFFNATALDQWMRATFHPGVSQIDILQVADGLLQALPTLPIIEHEGKMTRGPVKDLSKAKFTSVFTLPWFNLFLLGKSKPWKGRPCQM